MSTKQDVIELPGELGAREGCDAFELAIDVAAAGALDVVARGQLERHLEGCESCREYRDRSADLTALVALDETNLPPARWHQIEKALVTAASSPRLWIKRTVASAAFSLVYGVVLMLLAGEMPSARMWCVGALAMLGIFGSSHAYVYYRLRRELQTRDIMAVHRRQLQRVVEGWRTLRWLWLMTSALWFVQGTRLFTVLAISQLLSLVLLYFRMRRARRELLVLS